MSVKRFFARSAREALRMVKEEFGGDAVVLANRSVGDGVEIIAAPASALAALTPAAADLAPQPRPAATPTSAPSAAARPTARPTAQGAVPPPAASSGLDDENDFRVSLSGSLARRKEVRAWTPFAAPRVERAASTVASQRATSAPEPLPVQAPPTPSVAAVPAPAVVAAPSEPGLAPQLAEELAGIRQLIERQLAGFAWSQMSRQSPMSGALLGELLEAGFSGELSRRLVDAVPADADESSARAMVRSALSRELLTLGNDADLIDRGGVYALVGPTGVGKTTTTAKLAARCVVRHGADKLALLTTDSYRIGAHEQLRIYGRILGVSVHVIRDGADLRSTLADLRNKHMVLIDTVGMSQRDRAVSEQAAMLMNAGDVKRLLLLNAGSRGDTLDDVVRAYSGPDLAGAIVTKVDEAASLAPAIDVLVRHELDLYYVANGQRVPEDLHLANRAYLLHRALRSLPEDSAHRLGSDGAGLLLAHAAASGGQRQGAHLG